MWYGESTITPALGASRRRYTWAVIQVLELVTAFPALALALDASGRKAVDVASRPMKGIVQSVLLWHGRYRVTDLRPEHASATCFVFKVGVWPAWKGPPSPSSRHTNPSLASATCFVSKAVDEVCLAVFSLSHTHAHTRTPSLSHTRTHIHTHTHTHTHTCTHMHAHARTHANAHAHTHTHTRAYTRTHRGPACCPGRRWPCTRRTWRAPGRGWCAWMRGLGGASRRAKHPP